MKEEIEFILRIKGKKGWEFNDERTFVIELERDESNDMMRHMARYVKRKLDAVQRLRTVREQVEEKGENILGHL